MIYLEKNSTDPWFNLAAEEVALKSSTEDILMLWRNQPSVVLGKHQNAMAEVNHDFVINQNIPVLRRITGGGTVYHDLGNLNYTLITSSENRERLIDFPKFAAPVMQFLKQYGHKVSFYGKTNLGIQGKKFSGNAAHVFKNRVLHHGTLLFETDLEVLQQTIRPGEAEVVDKAVKSVRADIVNLSDLLPDIKDIQEFTRYFKTFLFDYFSIGESVEFNASQLEELNQLIETKYRTREWNYGYSPNYSFSKTGYLKSDKVSLLMEVKKGIIVALQLKSTDMPESVKAIIEQQLLQTPHHPNAMMEAVKTIEPQLTEAGIPSSFIFQLTT